MKFFDILSFAQLFIGCALLLLAGHSLRRKEYGVGQSLFLFLLLTSMWCLFSVFVNKVSGFEDKILLTRIRLLSPFFLPSIILFLAIDLNNEIKIKKLYFCIPPFVLGFLTLGPWYEWLVKDFNFVEIYGFPYLTYQYGSVFIIHTFLSRLYCLIAFFLILKGHKGRHRSQKITGLLIIASIALPLVVDTIAVHFYPMLRYIQLVPISLGVTGVLMTYVLFVHESLNILPFARSTIISSLSEACLMWNDRGILVDSNPSGVELFNIPSDIKKFSSTHYPYLKINGHEVSWKDGRYFQVKYENIFDAKNKLIGSYTLMRDITKVKQAEENLIKLNKVKSNILGVLSHDLCGHAGQLSFMTELLVLKDINLSEKESIDLKEGVFSLSKDLTFFLNNLLEWSKDQLNGWEVKSVPIDLKMMIEDICNFLSSISTFKKQKILIQFPSELTMSSDPKILEIILRNLIYNAIKHSSHGSIITIVGDGEKMSITNEGELPMEEVECMNKYFRDPLETNFVGYGLGHKICKEFSHAIGMHIEVHTYQAQVIFSLKKV